MSVLSLISGGIDSPVATYLMLKKGVRTHILHFYRDKGDLEKLKEVLKVLKKYGNIGRVFVAEHSKLFVRDFGRFNCIYCKILMVKTAEKLCKEHGCSAIVMGDNLGQVASQTLDNMLVISRASKIPIIRPLIGFDKEEIIEIAKNIGTYEISIKSRGCPFLPKNPVTKANPEKINYDIDANVDLEELIPLPLF